MAIERRYAERVCDVYGAVGRCGLIPGSNDVFSGADDGSAERITPAQHFARRMADAMG